MPNLTKQEKVCLSERFMMSMEMYVDFYGDYIETFNCNYVQATALSHLCDLARDMQKYTMELKSNGITSDEAYKLYNELMIECWGENWKDKEK